MRRVASLVTASVIAALGIVALPQAPAAEAMTHPPGTSGSAGADILGVDASAVGVSLANVLLGHAVSDLDPATTATAAGANLGAAVAGVPVSISSVQQIAPPDQPAPTSARLADVDLLGAVTATVIESTVHARSVEACTADGQSATTTTSLATAGVALAGIDVAELGASQVSATSALTAEGMRSTASGSIAGLSLLGGAVTIAVDGTATLEATSTGAPGPATVSYAAPSVRVTALGETVSIVPGGTALDIDIPLVGSVTIAMPNPTSTAADDGTAASTQVSLLDIGIELLAVIPGAPVASASLDVLPLTADATAAAVPTAQLCVDDVAIVEPVDGATVADPTPSIAGTGEPGATIDVTIDGSPVGTTTAAADGAWSLVPTTALADGTHAAVATQTIAGTTGSATVSFSIDTAAPAAPVIVEPVDGAALADDTPTVTGSGEPGATVAVAFDGVESGTTVVGDGGAWSFTPRAPLADGEHTVTAVQTDEAGNASPADGHAFTVDTTALAPVIEVPADGSVTNDTTPSVWGTGEPGATVAVSIDGAIVGPAPVAEDGTWSLALATPLSEGEHVVAVTQTDRLGNLSPVSSNAFTVDLTAPGAPAITVPTDGSVTSDATPTVSGTGEPGATVAVSIDGAAVGTAPVAEGGTWALDVSAPLDEGTHTAAATQTDAVGNASDADSVTFAIDLTAPAAPVIEAPADGSTTGDATPTVSGTGEPGATVAVAIDGVDVGTAAVGDDGAWSLELGEPLTEGRHTVEAAQADAAGNVSPASSVAFTVDLTAPAAPVIEAPADGALLADAMPTVSGTGEPGSIVTVVADGDEVGTAPVLEDGSWSLELQQPLDDGDHALEATQTDRAGNASAPDLVTVTVDATAPAAPAIETPADGAITADATPPVSGTGEPGAIVTVTIDGDEVGTAVVGDDGSWALELEEPLADGEHTIGATQTDEAGNTSAPTAVEITVDTEVAAPVIVSPVAGELSDDRTPTVLGTGEPRATVTVTVDGAPAGTVLVGADGGWSLELDEPLADGERTIGASQQDAAGNRSPETTVSVTIDATAPDAPVIESPSDGDVIDDPTPTIVGTGEPGATVVITIDGKPAGIAGVDERGDWSIEVGAALADGHHEVTATQTDAAGNASAPTTVGFELDSSAAPAQPGDGDGGGTGERPGSGGSLPRTGGELPAPVVLLGLMLLLGGAALARARRGTA